MTTVGNMGLISQVYNRSGKQNEEIRLRRFQK